MTCDLIGRIYKRIGIDPTARLPNPQVLEARVMPTPADGISSAGLLKEII